MKKLLVVMVVLAVLAVLLVAVMPGGAIPRLGVLNEDPPQPGGSPGQTPHDGPPGWSIVPGQGGKGP